MNAGLSRLLKIRSWGASPRWTPGKTLINVLLSSGLLALCLAVAVTTFHLLNSHHAPSKKTGDLQLVSEATPTPVPGAEPVSVQANPNVVYTGTIETAVAGNSTQSVHLASIPSPSPVPQSTVIAEDSGSHSAKIAETGRKVAERERRKAERKRARLEAMYQNHLISSAAYKKGQDKYQSEITKYHGELNGSASINE
jgi:hypothetical protein